MKRNRFLPMAVLILLAGLAAAARPEQAVPQAHACAAAHGLHALLHRLLGRTRQAGARPLWELGCECFAI